MLQLDDTSFIYFVPNFVEKEEADMLFKHLKTDIDWRESFGRSKKKPLPRLQCWMSDVGVKAKLFQKEPAMVWSEQVYNLKTKLEEWSETKGMRVVFDYVLMNKYRNGHDHIYFHRDDEAEEEGKNIIASVSFGATRKFIIKHKSDKKKQYIFDLPHGSLLVMAGDTQLNWVHSVPMESDVSKCRINLTFRKS